MRIFPEATGGFSIADKGIWLLGRPFQWSLTPDESVVRARVSFVPLVTASVYLQKKIGAQVITEPE